MTVHESAVDVASVAIWGLDRGREFGGTGRVALADGALLVALDDASAALAYALDAVDGVRMEGAQLTLYLRGGDVIELVSAERRAALGELAHALEREACSFDEQTRPLRGLGTRRGAPGSEHDRFYGPLLAARRALEEARDVASRVAAFDATVLRTALGDAITELAAARHAGSAPDRRALEAELQELATPAFDAMTRLGDAAAAVRVAPDDARFARWREWVAAAGALFEAIDRLWLAALPALCDSRGRRGSLWRRLLRLGVVIGSLLALAPDESPAQSSVRSSVQSSAPSPDPRLTLRVTGAAPDTLRRLGFDVVGMRGDDALVVAGRDERTRLALVPGVAIAAMPLPRGSRVALPADDIAAPARAPGVYRSYDDRARGIMAFLDSLARANPLVRLDTIGTTLEGRPIIVAKIGDAAASAARPNVLYMATYHAREWAATETVRRLLLALAAPGSWAPVEQRARITRLVAERDVWVLLVANPDGYEYSFTSDRLWRKNRRPAASGGVGVDLNRNHSSHWGLDDQGSSPSPASEIYRGSSPASELETQAVERFHLEYPPVLSLSYHSFSDLLLYPPGWRYGLLPGDLGIYRALAGTDERPAVQDAIPGSNRIAYRPAVGWNLYTVNGDQSDFAAVRTGTLAFTPELTSGERNGEFYGFEFPDDEALLQRLFLDNLPFAIDVLESAANPRDYRSPTTGMRAERIAVESVSPMVRVRVPAEFVAGTTIAAPAPLAASVDTAGGGRYMRRLVSSNVQRPREVRITAGGLTLELALLAAGGAEPDDAGWDASGFTPVPGGVAGGSEWRARRGTLRSPVVRAPNGTDTLSVLYWTRYSGNLFDPLAIGEVRVSRDGGRTFTREASIAGNAPEWYPEAVTLGGVAGRDVQVEFATDRVLWSIDEVTLVAHGRAGPLPVARTLAVRPSANPVRGDVVYFAWDPAAAGEIAAYDLAGRRVWQQRVAAGVETVSWDVANARVANGAYVVVVQSSSGAVRPQRATLVIARRGDGGGGAR